MNLRTVTSICLLCVLGLGCRSLTPGGSPAALGQLPAEEEQLIRKFFDATAQPATNEVTAVAMDAGETYVVVLDLDHVRAAVVRRDPEYEKSMGEVPGQGFFVKNAQGCWQRDDREEFEMECGVATLERYLTVLAKSEKGPLKRFEWRTDVSGQSEGTH